MIVVLVFGKVHDIRANSIANHLYREFRSRAVDTQILVQTISEHDEPIVTDKNGKLIIHEKPYALIFNVSDTIRNTYPSDLPLWEDVEKSLQKSLSMPVYIIA